MMMRWIFFLVFAGGMICSLCAPLSSFAEPQRVRAKIGVQVKSGEQLFSARSREILKPGDLLRIYVHSEEKSFVYVIHADEKNVLLLNLTEQRQNSSTLVLPSLQEFYQVDGKNAVEQVTIICSPQEIPELTAMVAGDIPLPKWQGIEQQLSQKSRIDLTTENETPFAIAGNVRGGGNTQDAGFINDLQIFSGNGLLVKQYAFQVKK
jgi:hypothetical protein